MTATGRFSCESCGKSFRWKPELAGRKAKCACGAVVNCPAQADDPDALYDLSPSPVMPVQKPVPAAPAPLAYRAPREDPGAVDQYFPNRTMDLYAPLWLIGGSVVIEVAVTLLFSRGPSISLTAALFHVGLSMIIGTAVMLVGILAAAKFRGISFGPFWTAVLKLAAISLGPEAAMMLMSPMLNFIPLGGLLNWIIGFCLYFALIGTFFELDQSDTWYCVCVIFIVKVAVFFGLIVLLFRGLIPA
jgi:hypothetical protein